MGSSKSSSQANQVSSATSTDNRVLNESGIVAQGSALDLSSYYSANTSNTSNITDNSSMFLSNYDTRDMSTSNMYNDSRSTANSFSDMSDNSVSNIFTDTSDRSVSNSFTDSSDRSVLNTTSNMFTDSSDRSVLNWFSDTSDRSTSNAFTDSRSTSSSFTDTSDRSTSNVFTDSRSTSNSFTDSGDRSTKSWDSSTSNAVSGSYNVTADPEIAKAAFNFATNNDAMLGAGLDRMLGFASELTNKSTDSATSLASRFQDGLAQAFDSGRNTTPGGIDNKTMIVLGVAGAAALAFMAKKGN